MIKQDLFTPIFSLAILFVCLQTTNAQVAIGTTSLENGTIFQMETSDKGLLLPRVSLLSKTDTSTITTLEEGLWVYNTSHAGSGSAIISPGFYFWNGDEWTKMRETGYSKQFVQTAAVRAHDQATTHTLTGLDQDITAPYSGTYQIYVIAYYACIPILDNSDEAMGYSSISLEIDNTKVSESFVTSSSKKTPNNFLALGQQTTIIYNVDLTEGQTYNFKVQAREWAQENMNTSAWQSFVPGNYGIWGIPTSSYNGNDLGIDNAQEASMTITLQQQY